MADVYLPADSQRRLMLSARRTLEAITRGCEYTDRIESDSHLELIKYGAFVTLYNQHVLRGCVGTCTPSSALATIVVEMTEAAATRDPRVKPVRVEELEHIQIHISVISPLDAADDPLNLEIGKHGLYIARNRKRGVFLPEVAVEHGWNPAEFLAQACIKANLPRNAWQWAGTKIALFTALQIEEER